MESFCPPEVSLQIQFDLVQAHWLIHSSILQVYGGLHIIFNNAGIMDSGDDNVINTPDDVIDRTLAINVKGVIYGCR